MQEYLRERAPAPDVVGWQICSIDWAVSERTLDPVLVDYQALRFDFRVKSQDHGARVAVRMNSWLAHLSDLVLDYEKDALGAMIGGILYGVLEQDLIVWAVKPTLLFVAKFWDLYFAFSQIKPNRQGRRAHHHLYLAFLRIKRRNSAGE